ncbi:MBL fold metallo-hydrolase [Xanthovirga aplysinae]|uniref:MBL fold metallo-hydrolase n=1 Tax=Xanthovirga aplysinae TaxID=2529853 RepID=UPI0012BC0D06|nr:MBL fold metallo-hydrolase [Xanthovirga aplysinae]MTI32750.1 MBL fold metallo-hydrolase [Xanthovirga aplysinae]
MNGKLTHSYFLLFLLIFSACTDDEDPVNSDETLLYEEMINAIGGSTAIENSGTISYQAVGEAFEFQEDPEPINGKVADFSYNLIYDLNGKQSKQEWSIQTDYAFETDLNFVETINENQGRNEGINGFFSQYFAGFGVSGDPMFSTKLAARKKTLLMSSPLAILKMISSNKIQGGKSDVISVGYNTSSLGLGSSTPDVELVIDPKTYLPLKAQVLENDPLYGDVLYEVVYGDWIEINSIKYPTQLTHVLDGFTIRTETLSNLEVNPSFDPSELTVPEADWAYDENEAKYGSLSSQFHFRMLMVGFMEDFPVEFTDATSQLALPSELVANDNKVFRVSGDFQSHYTYAFQIDGGILLYDSPLNNRRSSAVLEKVRSGFSSLPISYVVNSHNHFDHVGGLRGNLAEGGELIVGAGSKESFENILNKPYTVLLNPIAGRKVNVLGVEGEMVIGSGDEQIILYTIPTEHAEGEDFIIIYKPSTKTIYSTDLYNAGFGFVFDNLGTTNQERMSRLAKDLVEFVDFKGLDVETAYTTHGFTNQDFDFNTVRNFAGS